MATTKRFSASEIVNYRLSNSTKVVYFDTLDEAIKHVFAQRDKHPRSKKFNHYIIDTTTKKRESVYLLSGLINLNELPECWK